MTTKKNKDHPDNLSIWDSKRTPDPKFVKGFKRGGGFSGTAINTQYTLRQLTELFGPCGMGWKVHIISEAVEEGAPIIQGGNVVGYEKVHMMLVRLDYRIGDEWIEGPIQYGQTMLVGTNKYGPFTDEEAPKKSLTDAIGKCAAALGVNADIFLGLWDDNKYVNDAEQKYAKSNTQIAPSVEMKEPSPPPESLMENYKAVMLQITTGEPVSLDPREIYKQIKQHDPKLASELADAIKARKAQDEAAE